MVGEIIGFFTQIIISVIVATKYAGVFFLMLLESCGIPAPSEIIMPFSGFLAASGKLFFWFVVLAGTFGNLAGSFLAYYISSQNRYLFFSKHNLDRANMLFSKYGEAMVFVGRLLPVVRTYISFPAGIAKMKMSKFLVYTFSGSFIWCAFLAYLGFKLGKNWEMIHEKLGNLDFLILILIILAIILYILRRKVFHRVMFL